MDSSHYTDDGMFIPPHAPPLKGTESALYAMWKMIKNPVEGFGPLAYSQPVVSATTFGVTLHAVTDPEGMQDVLTRRVKDFRKSPLNDRIMKPATKEGLLLVHGEQWKRQRRGVAPMFAPRHMAEIAPLITEALEDFEALIDAGDGHMKLQDAMGDLTFGVLAKSILGNPQGLDRDSLKKAMETALKVAGTIRPSDLFIKAEWVPRPMGPRGYAAIVKIRKAADALISERDPLDPGDDLVGLLISARDPKTGQGLSPREQRDNLIGFFIAGHETTALTLTWALYLLAGHNLSETRLLDEVKQVVGDGPVRFDHLGKLPFCRAVIDETMRLFPPAPLMGRQAVRDTKIMDSKVAKNDIILLATYVMHRTERLWERPNIFDPDRFIRQPDLNKGKGKYMPFGGGPRVCVGAAFAIMEAVMALATLVRDYEIRPEKDCYPRPVMTITLRPEGGIPVRIKRRTP